MSLSVGKDQAFVMNQVEYAVKSPNKQAGHSLGGGCIDCKYVVCNLGPECSCYL